VDHPRRHLCRVFCHLKLASFFLLVWCLCFLVDGRISLAKRLKNAGLFFGGFLAGALVLAAGLAALGLLDGYRQDLAAWYGLFRVKSADLYSRYYSQKRFVIDFGRSIYSGAAVLAVFTGIGVAVSRFRLGRGIRIVLTGIVGASVLLVGFKSETAWVMTVNATEGILLITSLAVFLLSFIDESVTIRHRMLSLAALTGTLVLSLWSNAEVKLAAGSFLCVLPLTAWFWTNGQDFAATWTFKRGGAENSFNTTSLGSTRTLIWIFIVAFVFSSALLGPIRSAAHL
jgi:hypothetical protein